MSTVLINSKTKEVIFRFDAKATQENFDAACATTKNPFIEEVSNFTMAELTAIHNKLTGSSIKKFSDKATAVERVERDLEESEVPVYEAGSAPAKKAKAEKLPVDPETKHANLSAGVAKSWADPAVRAQRSKRHGVKVDGVEYTSVLKAFIALELDEKEHRAFRKEVKASAKPIKRYGKTWQSFER